jgi:predicted phage-related endonuclease
VPEPDWFPNGHCVLPSEYEKWKSLRKHGVGASEVAALMGCGTRDDETPLHVYHSKVSGWEPKPDEAMEIGSALEPSLERLYQARTGRSILKSQPFFRHGKVPLFATCDGIDSSGDYVEFKTIGAPLYKRLDDSGEPIPYKWVIQCHAQMACTGANVVKLGVLAAEGCLVFRIEEVHRDESLIYSVEKAVRDFWERNVAQGIPPEPVNYGDRKFAPAPGEGTIDLGDKGAYWADRFDQAKAGIEQYEKARDLAQARLAFLLGNNAVGLIPGGRKFTARKVTNKKDFRQHVRYELKQAKPPKEIA